MTDDPIQRIDAYLDGELDAEARAAFEARLRSDSELCALVDDERALRSLYRSALVEPAPVGTRARIAKALDADDAPPAPTSAPAPAAPRGRIFHFAYAAAVALLALAIWVAFPGDDDPRVPPPGGTIDATVPIFRAHRERDAIAGSTFDSPDVLAETFVGHSAPDLGCHGWRFHCGARGHLPRFDDPIVWTCYVHDGRELSLVMTKGPDDPRIPVEKERYLVRRDGDLVGVFWQEPNGMICGLVAKSTEAELREIGDTIRGV